MRPMVVCVLLVVSCAHAHELRALNSDAAQPMAISIDTGILPGILVCDDTPFFDKFHMGNFVIRVYGFLPSICPSKYDPQTLAMYQQYLPFPEEPMASCNESMLQLRMQSPVWRSHVVTLFVETYVCGTINTTETWMSDCNPVGKGYYFTNGTYVLTPNVDCVHRWAAKKAKQPAPAPTRPGEKLPRRKGGGGGKSHAKTKGAARGGGEEKAKDSKEELYSYEMCMLNFEHKRSGHKIQLANVDSLSSNVPSYLIKAQRSKGPHDFVNHTQPHTPEFMVISELPLNLFFSMSQMLELERQWTPYWIEMIRHHNRVMADDKTKQITEPKGRLRLTSCKVVTATTKEKLLEMNEIVDKFGPDNPWLPDDNAHKKSTIPDDKLTRQVLKEYRERERLKSPEQLRAESEAFLKMGEPLDPTKPRPKYTQAPFTDKDPLKTPPKAPKAPKAPQQKPKDLKDVIKQSVENLDIVEAELEASFDELDRLAKEREVIAASKQEEYNRIVAITTMISLDELDGIGPTRVEKDSATRAEKDSATRAEKDSATHAEKDSATRVEKDSEDDSLEFSTEEHDDEDDDTMAELEIDTNESMDPDSCESHFDPHQAEIALANDAVRKYSAAIERKTNTLTNIIEESHKFKQEVIDAFLATLKESQNPADIAIGEELAHKLMELGKEDQAFANDADRKYSAAIATENVLVHERMRDSLAIEYVQPTQSNEDAIVSTKPTDSLNNDDSYFVPDP